MTQTRKAIFKKKATKDRERKAKMNVRKEYKENKMS